jgi:glycolate oxidase
LWKGRKTAFGALGRITPNFYVQDGVIPRTRLPEMLDFIGSLEKKYDLHIGNIFHAGMETYIRSSCMTSVIGRRPRA